MQRALHPSAGRQGNCGSRLQQQHHSRTTARVPCASTLSAAERADAAPELDSPPLCVPEDLQLPPGVLSTITRAAPTRPADVFRCFGCTKPECQVSAECACAIISS